MCDFLIEKKEGKSMKTIKTEIEIRNKKTDAKRMVAYGQKLKKKITNSKKGVK